MSTAEKTLEKMRRNPRDWRIEDVLTVARKYNLLMRTEGGSHLKPVYIKQFVVLIDKAKE
jgi:hypothetical protein